MNHVKVLYTYNRKLLIELLLLLLYTRLKIVLVAAKTLQKTI